MSDIVSKALPVFLLFGFGIVLRYKNFFSNEQINGLKKFVMNVSLPAVLFQTFLKMELKLEYLSVGVLVVGLLLLLMLAGFLINKIPHLYNPFTPYMSTGYAYGLVGVSLFLIMYGEENLAIFSVMGLAHETFIWIIYYVIFKVNFQKDSINVKALVINIITTPIIISIFAGILLNVLNVDMYVSESGFWIGFLESVRYLSSTSTPLVLVILGYGMSIKKHLIMPSIKLVAIRIVVMSIIGVLYKIFIVDYFMPKDPLLDISYVSLLVLPPLLTLPILVSDVDEEQVELISNAVAITTVLSIITFVTYSAFVLQ